MACRWWRTAWRKESLAGNLDSAGAWLVRTSVMGGSQRTWCLLVVGESLPAECKSYDDGGEFHVGCLGSQLSAIFEGDEDGTLLLPLGASWYNCFPSGASELERLVGSRCSWETLRKSLLV
jgi:hypothetical protein